MSKKLRPAPATPEPAPGSQASISRQIRGLVLLVLAQEHPGGRVRHALEREVAAAGWETSEKHWDSHLAYLGDKDYLETEVREIWGRTITSYVLTPSGLDLVQGILPADPGIDFGR